MNNLSNARPLAFITWQRPVPEITTNTIRNRKENVISRRSHEFACRCEGENDVCGGVYGGGEDEETTFLHYDCVGTADGGGEFEG
jgi:hypothetical protein